MDRWLESIRDRVRPGTIKPYEAIVRLHIEPRLESTKLDARLSARRVRYIHVTTRKALQDAVRLKRLSRNVVDAAIPPRQTKTELESLTQEQLRTLLHVARGERVRITPCGGASGSYPGR
jgi:hypothetical protein